MCGSIYHIGTALGHQFFTRMDRVARGSHTLHNCRASDACLDTRPLNRKGGSAAHHVLVGAQHRVVTVVSDEKNVVDADCHMKSGSLYLCSPD